MQYAEFDPAIQGASPVIGWYDTDEFDYPNLPPDSRLIALLPEQWDARLGGAFAVENGQLVPFVAPVPPVLPADAAAVALNTPVPVTVASNAALNGSYRIDSNARQNVIGIASAAHAGFGLPGGGSTFIYMDAAGGVHQWPQDSFLALAKAMMNLIYAIEMYGAGHAASMPALRIDI